MAEAIYSKFFGSKFTQLPGLGGVWILPCEQEVNITFSFGGKLYPIHPLDMSMCVLQDVTYLVDLLRP